MPQLRIAPAGGDTATPRNLKKRLDLIRRHAGSVAGREIVDCGCGAGEYLRALEADGARCTGFEYQAQKLTKAGARVAVASLERIPTIDARFDVALLNEVLEHVGDDELALREVARVLRPGGTLLVFSPNRLYPFETHGVSARGSGRRISHAVPGIPYLPLALGTRLFRYWARNYWPWELRRMLLAAGFEVVAQTYVWQTFENISGGQPAWIRRLRVPARALAKLCEATPGLRRLGASQLLVARKHAPVSRNAGRSQERPASGTRCRVGARISRPS